MYMDNKKYKSFPKEEVEKFMNDKKAFDDWIRKGTMLYGAWDMINVDDDIMLDHLYEVLRFFGVKNLGAPSGKPFVSFKEVEPNEGDLGDYDVGPGKKYKDLADKISHQFGIPNHKRTEF